MSKNRRIMIIGLILVVMGITGWWFLFERGRSGGRTIKADIKGSDYTLEIAKSGKELEKGLSNRSQLCNRCGMVFVFPYEGVLPFWMKETQIPLDMIWVNRENKVVSIQSAEVETGVPLNKLKIYKNDSPASRVIELQKGEAERLGLAVGDTIKLPDDL